MHHNTVYFRAWAEASRRQIWRVTPSGATQVTNLNPVESVDPSRLTSLGNRLIFAGEHPLKGNELWRWQ